MTLDALDVLADAKVPVAVLTKSGTGCLRGMDAFKRFGEHIMVGQPLTFSDEEDSASIEPGAASPQDRLAALKALHEEGIKTFASFEPVIDPEQSLKLMEASTGYIDVYKVGKINNWRGRRQDHRLGGLPAEGPRHPQGSGQGRVRQGRPAQGGKLHPPLWLRGSCR